MLDILRPYFRGPWAPFGETLQLASDAPSTAPRVAEWLMSPGNLAAALQRHAWTLRSANAPRAVASDWTRRYLATLLPPMMGVLSLARRTVPASWHDMSVVTGNHGLPTAFAITQVGERSDVDSAAMPRYESLVWEHLRPLIDHLGRHARLPRQIAWGNVHRTLKNFFARALEACHRDEGLAQRVRDDQEGLLTLASWRDGRANPLFLRSRETLLAGEVITLHATCCLSHQLAAKKYCRACPLRPELSMECDTTEMDA